MIDIKQEERAAEARAAAEMIQILGHELLNGLDRDHINPALLVLIQNAAEAATADRGVDASAEIAVRQSDKQLAFEIRDNGNGIAPGHETLLFRPFHTTKREGTGIGLSLTR